MVYIYKQCCGSALVSIMRIRILIWIQHFLSMRIQIRIQIQVFMTKNWKQLTAEKNSHVLI
jgi:hypothetical protein